jgi:phthiodiolone/phenolphthiodiolone dimycocerosates ketoreductase
MMSVAAKGHAAYIRTTLPLAISKLPEMDSGRYHSIWINDHMVSFWPDSLWTPEFTDLATESHSPHRHLDGLAVAAAVAVLTKTAPIATTVVDTVRRHPSMLAQTALTIDHLSKGRFILGVGSGETENTVPYGFDFSKPVSRFEESLKVIRLLWDTDGPIDFEGQFYKLAHARLDTEPYGDRTPPIWIGCAGPRMLEVTGRYADGWWSLATSSPDLLADRLKILRASAERAARDPLAITPAMMWAVLIGEDSEMDEILRAPIVKSLVLWRSAEMLRGLGFKHPMGDDWGGYQDIDPGKLPRERMIAMLNDTTPDMVRAVVMHGTPQQIARKLKGYFDAGLRVVKIIDYSEMAGLNFQARSAEKVRETEDELQRLVAA